MIKARKICRIAVLVGANEGIWKDEIPPQLHGRESLWILERWNLELVSPINWTIVMEKLRLYSVDSAFYVWRQVLSRPQNHGTRGEHYDQHHNDPSLFCLFESVTMPPKKKNQGAEEDLGLMRAARFGRVKNTLTMGFVGLPNGGCIWLRCGSLKDSAGWHDQFF